MRSPAMAMRRCCRSISGPWALPRWPTRLATHSLCEFDRSEPDPSAQGNGRRDRRPAWKAADSMSGSAWAGKLTLRNIVPGHFLAPRIQAADALVLFSATLQPGALLHALLGLPDDTRVVSLPSPFHSRPAGGAHRAGLDPSRRPCCVAGPAGRPRLRRSSRQQPGNYLAFFSSFDYLEHGRCSACAKRYPAIPVWSQARQMDEPARRDFLRRFDQAGQGIGFAVLGGVFGEGVDLPGRRLIGAFVATLGLPQFDPVNEAIRARMERVLATATTSPMCIPACRRWCRRPAA